MANKKSVIYRTHFANLEHTVVMKDISQRSLTALILGASFFVAFFFLPSIIFSFGLLTVLAHILIVEWPNFFAINDPRFWFIAPIYPIAPFALLIILNQHQIYRELLLALFVIVACADIGGYLFGSLFGRHKIAPHISPGKSWEGFLGGYVLALAGIFILLQLQHKTPKLLPIAGIAFMICTLSTIGDLFESWLKRRAGIKDSGSILPGHGGFLDRFDGILFGVMVVYVFKNYLIRIFS